MNKIFLLVLTLMLVFMGCTSQYSFEENEFDNTINLESQIETENSVVTGNAQIKETEGDINVETEIHYNKSSESSVIVSDVEVVQVYATDTSDGLIGENDLFTVVLRLSSGSASVNLNDLLIKLDTKNASQTIQYMNLEGSSYNVSYISNEGEAINSGYLTTGDLVQIDFLNNLFIAQGDTATINLLIKNDEVKSIQLSTPSTMNQRTTYLFP